MNMFKGLILHVSIRNVSESKFKVAQHRNGNDGLKTVKAGSECAQSFSSSGNRIMKCIITACVTVASTTEPLSATDTNTLE